MGSRDLGEKLCVSWALSLIECVAVWALKLISNRFPQKIQKELHAFSAKTTNKAKICGKRCIYLVIFLDKVEFQGKNASKCNPITQITEKELPSPHKATSSRPNAHTANQSPKQTPPSPLFPSPISSVAKFFGVCKSAENFVLSGYKHMGIWHVSLTCRYPYAFV